MDKRILYEVVFYYKETFKESLVERNKRVEMWTPATLASRLTNPFFLVVNACAYTINDPKVIQNASRIEAMALK